MFQIAMIEDEEHTRQEVERLISREFEKLKVQDITTEIYKTAEEFLEVKKHYDVVISDIDLPGKSGIDLGRILKANSTYFCLVFLTSYAEFAVDSYVLEAYQYILKRDMKERLPAVLQKIYQESDPDWAKSATDMMNQISVQKKTSTSSRTIWIGVGGFAGALLLLVVLLVVFHILRKKGVIGHRRKGRHSGRHGAVAERIQPVKEWGAESENEDYVNPDTASTQDSKSVQETSSEASDA